MTPLDRVLARLQLDLSDPYDIKILEALEELVSEYTEQP